MRHLLALLTLAFVLVACDDEATTAPVDNIPGPPNAPYLKVTVLTGTKAAPVDSPTVKVEWKYRDSVSVGWMGNHKYISDFSMKRGVGDSVIKVGCFGNDSISAMFMADRWGYGIGSDSVVVHCK